MLLIFAIFLSLGDALLDMATHTHIQTHTLSLFLSLAFSFCFSHPLSLSLSLSLFLECNGAVEVRNRMIKKRMAAITAKIGRHAMADWTAVAAAAVRSLNNSPTARGGKFSAPSLLAEGEVDPRDYLLPEDVGTPAGQQALPDVTSESQFLVDVRKKVCNFAIHFVCVSVCVCVCMCVFVR